MTLHPLLLGLALVGAPRAEERHWAFVPPARPEVPAPKQADWVRNPIDAFILQGLEEFGLRPAPEADRATLLRRLSFDLTGLPPTPEEVEDFLGDRRPDAYEALVDRLLESPRYGERWARHWLDLARYADSDGFEFDETRPDAWRYRDWVVGALNRDLPYDEFVRLQLAGDDLALEDPDAAVATGFNRCYPDMVDLNDQGLRRQNALNDITETTGLVFLGLTIGCARCHDHKYDPIPQVDYFRLQAFFTPARFRDDFPVATAGERARHERAVATWRGEVAAVQASLIALEAEAREALAPGPPPGLDDRTRAAFDKAASERDPAEVALVFEALTKDRRAPEAEIVGRLSSAQRAERAERLGVLRRLNQSAPPALPLARILEEPGGETPPTHVLVRGDYYTKGAEVSPGFPSCMEDEEPDTRPGTPSSGRRAALARWLTSPDHPLTSRVMANRLWQGHFGRGIVATPSDFGVMGEAPTHPELLDWLAVEFIARGWSLKVMHRLIVASAAYRQSSRGPEEGRSTDPENQLLGRFPRRRLEGEAIRDAMLAASGLLNAEMGGPCVFPELPPELTKLSSKGAVWPVSPDPRDRARRGLYVFIRRNLRFPFFEVFDLPDTNASCPRRSVSTVAPQALSLLNGRSADDAARALAGRVGREAGGDDASRVERAYLLTLGRRPDAVELRLALDFLARGSPLADLCLALFNLNEFVYVD